MEQRKRIYLCLAHMSETGEEQKYIKEAFDTNWVVPLGPNVNAFEQELERFVCSSSRFKVQGSSEGSLREKSDKNLIQNLPKDVNEMTDQELAVWYNDNVIYPDKVRLNKYYYEHYSFLKDIQMIVCTVLGKKMKYAGEVI